MTYLPYNVAHDNERKLQTLETTVTILDDTVMGFTLASGFDNQTYVFNSSRKSSDECTTKPLAPVSFALNPDPWDIFLKANEDPEGTFTVIISEVTYILVVEDGLPKTCNVTIGTGADQIDMPISYIRYDNRPPPFYMFSLPEACRRYTCNACYSSAVSITSSLLLLVSALVMFLLSTV
ncbi:hypothetical protein LOD99_8374 [Oopsacas minuta]|uniref:Uncharacterized protein n=1 Tax=Oopsacas minuta TaxID=111878 RepID=A0AAV7JGI8_9METZ|nr:hypothetical protein LOD99_8374 [Oopsacas minuta]